MGETRRPTFMTKLKHPMATNASKLDIKALLSSALCCIGLLSAFLVKQW
jgi:hypothetical protein